MLLKISVNATHNHTRLKMGEAITTFGWNDLPHQPHSPDLAHSDFCFFGALKDAICERRFGSVGKFIEEVAASTKLKLVQ
jgi:hypothetical protein